MICLENKTQECGAQEKVSGLFNTSHILLLFFILRSSWEPQPITEHVKPQDVWVMRILRYRVGHNGRVLSKESSALANFVLLWPLCPLCPHLQSHCLRITQWRSHSPGHFRPGPCGPWHSVIWGSTQQRRMWDALWRWIRNRTPCRALESQNWIWQSQEDLEEYLGHEFGDCVLGMSTEQMWFGVRNLWCLGGPFSAKLWFPPHFCGLFCLPLFSHLHDVRVNTTRQMWVLVLVHLLVSFTFM
jgi:hypothetical protein